MVLTGDLGARNVVDNLLALAATQDRPPTASPKRASNSFTFGPVVIQPVRSTATTASMSDSVTAGRAKGM